METLAPPRSPDELEGSGIILRPLDPENIYQHYEWNNDRELNRLDSEFPFERESFHVFKKRFDQMVDNPAPFCCDFEIHTDDDSLIGVAHVTQINKHNRRCTASITIGNRDYWNKGYGGAALERILQYCFETLDMHRVGTEVFEYNDAWEGLVESMGFVKEGTLRDYLHRDGRFWDLHVYALLATEYER